MSLEKYIRFSLLLFVLVGIEDKSILYGNITNMITERTGSDFAVDLLEDLGLLEEDSVIKCGTPLDTLTHYLSTKLAIGKFIIIFHSVNIMLLTEGENKLYL